MNAQPHWAVWKRSCEIARTRYTNIQISKHTDISGSAVTLPAISEDNAPKLAEMLKALGHPVRLRIVSLLCGGDMRVSELADELALRQSLVSQQLRPLRMLGLVEVTRDSGVSRYTLAEPRLVDLLQCMTSCRRA